MQIDKVYVLNYDKSRIEYFLEQYNRTDIPYLIDESNFSCIRYDDLTPDIIKYYGDKYSLDYKLIIQKIHKKTPKFYSSALRYLANWISHLVFIHDAIDNKYQNFIIFEDNVELVIPEIFDDIKYVVSNKHKNFMFKLTLGNRKKIFNFDNMYDFKGIYPIPYQNAMFYHVTNFDYFKNWITDISANKPGPTLEATLYGKKELPMIIHKNYFKHFSHTNSMVTRKRLKYLGDKSGVKMVEDFDDVLSGDMIKFMEEICKDVEVKHKKMF